ncbi:ATP-grasp fold amidoligase family protein [Zobellia nedashkovskayae]|uniref:ATP-grasp fold amidoligase family protein n=1 Tax=Zobellia nedashkovskayae TaxID=2779510 RepID=UPI00188A1F45|nr:ATP-grasp fold amidoligase family protein [Zobellia nedashkovskayae]
MKKILKKLYNKTSVGRILIQKVIDLNVFYWTRIAADQRVIKRVYKESFGRPIDLENPKTLNEKINWLKLNDRTSLHTMCADKYAVRAYIEKNIGSEYLVPLLIHTQDPTKITKKNLPDSPCIIKTNHDSGGGYFVINKEEIDIFKIQSDLKIRLEKNYAHNITREWQYKNIPPLIIVESLLQTKEGAIPMDYKLHCFNGKVRMIQVDIGRGTKDHYRNWYSIDWKREPYKWSSKKENGKYTDPANFEVPAPKTLTKMIELSKVLAKPFCYVRVDWYDVDGKLYFGELTFHHDSGFAPILPSEWDLALGSELLLAKTQSQ